MLTISSEDCTENALTDAFAGLTGSTSGDQNPEVEIRNWIY